MNYPFYQPLDKESCEIRVLRVLPDPTTPDPPPDISLPSGPPSTASLLAAITAASAPIAPPSTHPVHCEIVTTSLHAPLPYAALSYVWGAPAAPVAIYINGTAFAATPSLAAALRHLRGRTAARLVWADAVCINQADMGERGHQVGLMRRIYSQADAVLSWLGGADNDDNGFAALRVFAAGMAAQPRHTFWLDTLLTVPSAAAPDAQLAAHLCTALALLDVNPHAPGGRGPEYWTRVWIRQELGLARRGMFFMGRQRVSYAATHGLLRGLVELINAAPGRMQRSVQQPAQFAAYARTREAVRLVFTCPLASWTGGRAAPRALLVVLGECMNCAATDARDRVFALLGIAAEGAGAALHAGLQPDYTRSLRSVFTGAAWAMVDGMRSLEALQHAWARADGGLPSWVGDWADSASFSGYIADGADYDDYDDDDDDGDGDYDGDDGAGAAEAVQTRFSPALEMLSVRGVAVGRVARTAHVPADYDTADDQVRALAAGHALAAGLPKEGERDFWDVVTHSLEDSFTDGIAAMQRRLSSSKGEKEISSDEQDLLDQVWLTCSANCIYTASLFKDTQTPAQTIGLGRPLTHVGDLVVLFFGLRVPVLLHPLPEPGRFQFLGFTDIPVFRRHGLSPADFPGVSSQWFDLI